MLNRRNFMKAVGAVMAAPLALVEGKKATQPVPLKQIVYVIDAVDDNPDVPRLDLHGISSPSQAARYAEYRRVMPRQAIQFKTLDKMDIIPGDVIDVERGGIKKTYRAWSIKEEPYAKQT